MGRLFFKVDSSRHWGEEFAFRFFYRHLRCHNKRNLWTAPKQGFVNSTPSQCKSWDYRMGFKIKIDKQKLHHCVWLKWSESSIQTDADMKLGRKCTFTAVVFSFSYVPRQLATVELCEAPWNVSVKCLGWNRFVYSRNQL